MDGPNLDEFQQVNGKWQIPAVKKSNRVKQDSTKNNRINPYLESKLTKAYDDDQLRTYIDVALPNMHNIMYNATNQIIASEKMTDANGQ